MEHLYWDLGECATGAQFEVNIRGSSARVCLMDLANYAVYESGLENVEYEFHGGFFDWTPVVVEVPNDGYWFLVVDSYHRRLRVDVVELFD